jgi:peptidoglycan hydrolase CwlO-like protein
MAQLINDWQELQRFQNELVTACENLNEQVKKTDAALTEVNKTWKDDQFKKYQESFNEDKKRIGVLRQAIEELNEEPLAQLREIVERYTQM